MKIQIVIFNYQRQDMLNNLLEEIETFENKVSKYHSINTLILDDGSDYIIEHENVLRFENGGKKLFWKRWDICLRYCSELVDTDLFIFLPNDYSQLNFIDILKRYDQFKKQLYIYNIVNDGRDNCWTYVEPKAIDKETIKIGFTDCGFFTNYRTLNELGFFIEPINPIRFNTPNISSGVGQQLTTRLKNKNINCYKPVKSLAFHGEHDSTMHKEERLKNKLTSK